MADILFFCVWRIYRILPDCVARRQCLPACGRTIMTGLHRDLRRLTSFNLPSACRQLGVEAAALFGGLIRDGLTWAHRLLGASKKEGLRLSWC